MLRDSQAQQLLGVIEELAEVGVNVIIAEVDYSFAFAKAETARYQFREEGHPPVSQQITKALATKARSCGIRLIPQFNCLGHQGINSCRYPLLELHQDFDETPGHDNIPTRAWCPQHPGVMPVVLPLIDEIIDVFEADAFHVGMDEVLQIASPLCARGCAQNNPAELFAGVVNQLHDHLTKKRGLPMLMWGDRLVPQSAIPGATHHEASANGTHAAIHLIPRDITVCDWRFRSSRDYHGVYPSIRHFLDHGFKVWPAGGWLWENASPFSQHALELRNQTPDVLGFLCTTWNHIAPLKAPTSPSIRDILPLWENAEQARRDDNE
jgi:hypothetical protein